MTKEDTIKEVYLKDFGTAYQVYKDAVKIDNSIRLQDVKDYFNSREDKQLIHKNYNKNSFVSKHALYEIELDIMDMGTSVNVMRFGLVAIDNFTKKGWVVPIQSNKVPELIRGLKEVFIHIGIPEQFYSDEEGGFNSKEWNKIMNDDGIKHIQTSTHAPTVERFIRTIKEFLHRRLDALNQDRSQWPKHIKEVIEKYNNTEHTTTKLKPTEATKKENFLWTAWHIANNARKEKKYPHLSINDKVRINIKPKKSITKDHDPRWTKEVYQITYITSDGRYMLNHPTRRKVFLRHELLKV